MLKLTVTYVAKSGTSAIVTVTKKIGFASSTIASGWMKVDAGTQVGQEIDLPDDTVVTTRIQDSEPDDNGVITQFTWVVLA